MKNSNIRILGLVVVLAVLTIGSTQSFATGNAETPSSSEPASTNNAPSPAPAKPPSYHNTRFEENWSVMRDSPERTGWNTPKYIPLSKSGTVYMSLGGQLRLRSEHWDSFGFGGPGTRNDAFGLLRLRLHTDIFFGPNLRLFVEGKSALANGRELPGGNRTIDTDSLALQNVFVDVKVPLESSGSFVFRVGRQELQFGKQRLVSPLDWVNTRRFFDGFRGIVKTGSWRIDGFWTKKARVRKYRFNPHDTGIEFFGLYASGKLPNTKLSLDVYWLRLDRDSATFAGVTAAEQRHTFGAQTGGKLDSGMDFNFEGAYQSGGHGSRSIGAFMFASQVGYGVVSVRTSPRVYAGLEYSSGDDDPIDQEVNTFNQLFPLGHAYNGFIDIVARQNIINFNQGLSLKPLRLLTVKVDHHLFWRAKETDALYNAGAGVVRSGSPGTSKRVGSELDFTFIYKLNARLATFLGYSHFFAGDFISETGSSEDINFGYLAVQYTF